MRHSDKTLLTLHHVYACLLILFLCMYCKVCTCMALVFSLQWCDRVFMMCKVLCMDPFACILRLTSGLTAVRTVCLSEKSCAVRYECTHTRHFSICLLSIENRQISCGKSRSRLVHPVITQSHLSLYRASMRAKSYKTMFVLHMDAPNGVVRDCACGRCAIRDVQLF